MSSRRVSSPRPVLVLVPSCVAGLWFASCSRACPSSVIRHPSDVADRPVRRRLLLLPPLSLLACRCHPLGAGYAPIRLSPRLGVLGSGAGWICERLSRGDLLVFLGCRRPERFVSLRVMGIEKKIGGGFFVFPSPCLLAGFLASANYSTVLPDFVVALGGLSEAGFALLVRVELNGNCGLVLIGLLLACLASLEKHGFVLSS